LNIYNYANDSGGNKTLYNQVDFLQEDVSDGTEAGGWDIRSVVSGTMRSILKFVGAISGVPSNRELVINDDGVDIDFRVEGAGAANALFVQGSDGKVGIGTAEPINSFNVNGAYNYFIDTSSVNDSYGFVTGAITAYTTGMQVFVNIGVANTGAATLQINALGAKAIKKRHDQDLITGDIEVGQIVHLIYDGTNFQMLSQLAQ